MYLRPTITTHIPNKREPLVRYYGFYSNRCRGDRKKKGKDDTIPAVVDSGLSSKAFQQNWARLIKKIYEVDPLLCPKCQGLMKIISFIDQHFLIKRILKHLSLWDIRNHDPPVQKSNHIPELTYDDAYSQIPMETATGFSEFEYVHAKFNLYMHNSTGGVRIKTVKL
jgi:hypothetical protein